MKAAPELDADWTPWPEDVAQRYRAAGYWAGQTLGDMLRVGAVRYRTRLAVVAGPDRWTYGDLDERADRRAAAFHRLGIRAGDRVVVQLPNVAEFAAVWFGLFRLGALPVAALPAHRSNEIVHFCAATEARALVVAGRHAGVDYGQLATDVAARAPALRHLLVAGETDGRPGLVGLDDLDARRVELPSPDPAGLALLQVSGGSTGLPKLVPRTHDDYLYSVRASAEICRLDATSVYLAALPVAHNFPLSSPGLLGTLSVGGTVVLAEDPSPRTAFPLVAAERVTITGLVPSVAMLWTAAAGTSDHDLSSLEVVQVGGAKLAETAARRIGPALGARLQQVFGMAEGLVNYTRLDDDEDTVVSTQGRPISPADEVRVVDADGVDVPTGEVGQLITRGPYTIRGYYRGRRSGVDSESFTPDGFYRTGDEVRRTEAGELVVVGRVVDRINRGGEKIVAAEVEEHLLAHPAVLDAAVVGVPDAYLGERTCAFVLARDPAPTPARLRQFLRDRGLATYKVPDRVEVVDRFPVTAVGKTRRSDLRAALAEVLTGPSDGPRAGPAVIGLPAIKSYPMPRPAQLPPNRVEWEITSDRSLLLVHDMQDHFVKAFPSGASPREDLLTNIARLVRAAEGAGVPVVYTVQPGDQTPAARGLLWDFWGPGLRAADAGVVAELRPSRSATVLVKHRYSAFQRTTLADLLAERSRDQLVVCGIYAHIGVTATACEAFMRDVAPFVVGDAVADFSADRHRWALEHLAGQCAVVRPTEAVVSAWNDPPNHRAVFPHV